MDSDINNIFTKNRPKQTVSGKSLIGIPERFAIAMTDELGWIRRNTIIWKKRNCMPSSARDRFTVDFEPVYFFTKSQKYWFEQQREFTGNEATPDEYEKNKMGFTDHAEDDTQGLCQKRKGGFKRMTHPKGRNKRTTWQSNNDQTILDILSSNKSDEEKLHALQIELSMKTERSVWDIPTAATPDAHFATFPEALVETPIKAGCPPDGIVLDPFAGTGTTCRVAKKLGRNYIGFELKPDYIEMGAGKLSDTTQQFALELEQQ